MAAILVEWYAQRILPAQYPRHEVDRMLNDLDQGRMEERDTVFLGDSVGRQIARVLWQENKGTLVPLASNASIETPGQYFVFRRYLEHHAPPKRVVLMMGNPVNGQLESDFTENYFQRCFLRWSEIAEIALTKRSLSFSLVMVGYKLFPTFRYRQALQETCPLLERPLSFSGPFDLEAQTAKPKATSEHGILDMAATWLKKHRRSQPIAETYFLRLAALFERLGIPWAYLTVPAPESKAGRFDPDGIYGLQMQRAHAHAGGFPLLRMSEEFRTYPDEWFNDGIHLHGERLPLVAADYARILNTLGFQ